MDIIILYMANCRINFCLLLIFLLLHLLPESALPADLQKYCEHKEIPIRRGSILDAPLTCCSYSALFRNDYGNLTVRWTVDNGDKEVKFHCQVTQVPSSSDFVKNTSLSANSSNNNNSNNSNNSNQTSSLPLRTETSKTVNCSKTVWPQNLGWFLNESDVMSLSLGERPLEIGDSGVYDCYTSVDSNRYVTSISLKVRAALPSDDLEPPVIPHITRENGNFTIRICWNSEQWSPDAYDPVTQYEVRVLRQTDNALVAQSGRLDAHLPTLQLDAFNHAWNSPVWPLSTSSPCCCWEVPSGNLKPFSSYLASYRVFGEDSRHPGVLRSETNFSRATPFYTPGMPGSVIRAELVELDAFGTGATVRFNVKPVTGEYPVAHQLNVTVIKPAPGGGKAADSDKVVVQPNSLEVNKTLDNLRPFSRYVVKAFVVNPAGASESRGFSFITLPGELDPIRSLRAETQSASSISVKFYIPALDQQHSLMMGEDFHVQYMYTIAYEVLQPDLTTSICPHLDELCEINKQSNNQQYYDPVDCQCLIVESSKSTRFVEEQISIGGLRPNRPYRLSVRYFFESAQFSGSALLWPDTLYSPWTGLHGKSASFVFTDSVGIRSPPYLRNVSLTVLNDSATSFLISFSVSLELTLEAELFESVWAMSFRCGNWTKVVPLNQETMANSFYNQWTQPPSRVQVNELIQFEVDALKERSLPSGDKRCRFIACPLTRSRINASYVGQIGPCSQREHIIFSLPERLLGSDELTDAIPQNGAITAAIVSIVVSVVIILVISGVIITLYVRRRQRSLFCCVGKKFGRGRSGAGDLRSSSSAGVQLLAVQQSNSSNSGTTNKRPLSCLSNGDGPLAGSMFCYKVASASFVDFAQEFSTVCAIALNDARKGGFTTREAELQVNLGKNRYSNVLPYDHTRVTLTNVNREGNPGADYVNANFVQVDDTSSNLVFIACQGPLQWTTGDFWQVVYERNVTKIVMLTDLIENSPESVRKCAPYWPRLVAQGVTYKNFRVILMRQRQRSFWVERVFEVSRVDGSDSDARLVMHYQFSDWPDHGVPQHALPLLRFTQRVMTSNPSNSPTNPIVVHCSAGIGRSGVFMVLANELERLATRCQVDPAGCLVAMRRCRANLVQTPEQFRFIYLALYEAVRAQEVGDHCGLGVPTEANRLQAWLKFDAENGSKMCDWATSRVPLQNANNSDDEDFSFNGYGGGGNAEPQANASYYLPGPLHPRQIVIISTRDAAFLTQRIRIWAAVQPDMSPSGLHLVFISEQSEFPDELAEQFRKSYPKLGVTSISTWPPPNAARICSAILPYLLNNHLNSSENASDSVPVDMRSPCVIIITANNQTATLAIAAELALVFSYLGEARLAFSVDADPDPDGHVDLLLFGRIATLTLPQGVLARSNLQRALSICAHVAAANSSNMNAENNLAPLTTSTNSSNISNSSATNLPKSSLSPNRLS